MPISKITGASIDTAGSGVTPAGLSTGGPTWDTGGNVGIGTGSPAGRLHSRYDAGASEGYIGKHIFQTTDQSLFVKTYWESGVGQHTTLEASNAANSVLTALRLNGDTLQFQTGSTERARIDSSGRMTLPYQPHYVGDERSSILNTGGEATYVDWVHSITRINTGSHMNTSTGVFTCPVAGRYFVQFNVLARATGAHNVEIRKNNSLWVRSRDIVGTAGNEECNSLSTVVDCAVNDNIRISVSNGASADFYNQWNSTTIYLVG